MWTDHPEKKSRIAPYMPVYKFHAVRCTAQMCHETFKQISVNKYGRNILTNIHAFVEFDLKTDSMLRKSVVIF